MACGRLVGETGRPLLTVCHTAAMAKTFFADFAINSVDIFPPQIGHATLVDRDPRWLWMRRRVRRIPVYAGDDTREIVWSPSKIEPTNPPLTPENIAFAPCTKPDCWCRSD